MENYQKHRPLGVTIIAILTVIAGIAFAAIGAILLAVGIGFALVVLAIAYFVVAYGLWKGKRWAWTITHTISNRDHIRDCFNCCWECRSRTSHNHKCCDYLLLVQTECKSIFWQVTYKGRQRHSRQITRSDFTT
jgi:hypothetical protein